MYAIGDIVTCTDEQIRRTDDPPWESLLGVVVAIEPASCYMYIVRYKIGTRIVLIHLAEGAITPHKQG